MNQRRDLVAVYALSRTVGLARELGIAVVFGTTVAADRLSAGLVVASLAAIVLGEVSFATHVRRATAGVASAALSWEATARRVGALSLAYVVPGTFVTLAILPSAPLGDLLALTACLSLSVGCAAAAGLPNAVLTLNARVARVNLAQVCWSSGALLGLLVHHAAGGGVALVATGWSGGTLVGLMLATHWASRIDPTGHETGRPIIDWRIAAPVALAFGLVAMQSIVDRGIASRLGEGSVAALGYGDRLFLLPVGFVISAVAPTVLAAIVDHKRERRGDEGNAITAISTRLVRIALPAAFLLFAASPLIVEVVLSHGAFDADSAKLTVAALDGLAISVGATSLSLVIYRAMQAVLPLADLARVAGAVLVVSAVLSGALAMPLGLRGVTLGTALAACWAIALQTRRLSLILGPDWGSTFRDRVLIPTTAWTALGVAMCVAVTDAAWLRPAAIGPALISFAMFRRG